MQATPPATASGSHQPKRKHAEEPNATAGPSSTRGTPVGAGPERPVPDAFEQRKKQRINACPPPNNWHLHKGDLPEGSAKTKTSVTSSINKYMDIINNTLEQVQALRDSIPQSTSIIANNVHHMGDSHMLLMFRTVADLGLERWAPDVLSADPTSMYNMLYEHIAILTFQQVADSFGYNQMGIDLQFIKKFGILCNFYRSYVFSYMHDIAKREARSPGSAVKAKQMTPIWKRRAEDQGFKASVISLAKENEAHSDDELVDLPAPNIVYHIKEKEGRSDKVTSFFQMTDVMRHRMARAKSRHHKAECRCEEPEVPQVSELTTRPKSVPIDWFDPVYWNSYMSVHERANCHAPDGSYHVTLPLVDHCGTWEDCAKWKTLPHNEFMHLYGNDVLKLYNQPIAEEIAQMEEWEATGAADDEESDVDRDHEDEAQVQGVLGEQEVDPLDDMYDGPLSA
ncbi:hypothetical protein DXG01_013207 [Tephrocybe rancida]|nr:hypothetical protein DXG01_013207 [Tephrocybe rancida]